MDFIREINAFEQWLRTNYLPPISQLLWYKLFMLCNGAGWPEWFVVENIYLMSLIKLKNEKSFIGYRDRLLESGLIEYKKGKKGSPNRYKLISLLNCTCNTQAQTAKQKNTYNLQAHSTAETTAQMTAETTAQSTDLYKLKENINENITDVVVDDSTQPQMSFVEKLGIYSQDLKDIQKHYETHVKKLLSPTAMAECIDFMDEGVEVKLICRAIDQSINADVKKWVYVKSIINNCICDSILTLEQYEKNETDRQESKNRLGVSGGVRANGANRQPLGRTNPYENIKSIEL